jgi:hypothetical protein
MFPSRVRQMKTDSSTAIFCGRFNGEALDGQGRLQLRTLFKVDERHGSLLSRNNCP